MFAVVFRAAAPALFIIAFTITFYFYIDNKAIRRSHWNVYYDSSNRAYYHNLETQATTWTAPDCTPDNAADVSGWWDFGGVEHILVAQRGVELRCDHPTGAVGIGRLGMNQTIEWHWPPTTPWNGNYKGTLSEGSRPVEIKWAGASWYRSDRKQTEILCTLEKLHSSPPTELHYDAQMAKCLECKCAPGVQHWTGDIYILPLVYTFLFALFIGIALTLPDLPIRTQLQPCGYLDSIGFIRFIAAIHILLCHYYGHIGLWVNWGYSWVPWFFCLAGFLLTETAPKEHIPISFFLMKRSVTILPLHYLALIISLASRYQDFWNVPNYNCNIVPTTSWSFITQIFLIHSWLPCGGQGFPWNNPAWFLSCLFFFWIIFLPLNNLFAYLSQTRLMIVCCMCFAWSFTGTFIISTYSLNIWNRMDNGIIFRLFASTHPLCFWQTFVFGMCLRRLQIPENIIPWCTPASLIFLFILFNIGPWNNFFWWEHGLLSLPHGALIIGLSYGADPISRALKKVSFLGQLSYGIYILQNPVWALIPYVAGFLNPITPTAVMYSQWFAFVLYLCICTLAHILVEKPLVSRGRRFVKHWIDKKKRPSEL